MVEIFKIFLPCTTRARLGSLRTAPALYLSIGDAGEHGGRYIFFVLKPRSLCEQTPSSFFDESAQ